MSILRSHFTRSLFHLPLRLFAIVMIASLAFALFVGSYSATKTLIFTKDQALTEGNIADFEFMIATDDPINLPHFSDIPNIKKMVTRLKLPGSITSPKISNGLLITDDHHTINQLTVLEGRIYSLNSTNEIVIERQMAYSGDYNIGDTITFASGNSLFDLSIVGIVQSPEYIISPANPHSFIPIKGGLAVIYGPSSIIEEKFGFGLINSLLFDLEEKNNNDITPISDRIGSRFLIEKQFTAQDQFASRFLAFDLQATAIFMPSMILISSLITLISLGLFFKEWLYRERPYLASLTAMGVSHRQMFLAVLPPLNMLLLLILLLGSFFSIIVCYLFASHYATAIGMPAIQLQLSISHLIIASMVITIIFYIALLLPAISLLSLHPQQLMRGANFPSTSQRAVINLGPLWFRYASRNLLRNKGLYTSLLLTLSMMIGLTLSLLISSTSFTKAASSLLATSKWQYSLAFTQPATIKEINAIKAHPSIASTTPYLRNIGHIINNNQEEYIILMATELTTENIQLRQGNILTKDNHQSIMIEASFAKQLHLTIGDTVSLYLNHHKVDLTLLGTFTGSLPHEAYITIKTGQSLMDQDGRYHGLFIETHPNQIVDIASLVDYPNIAALYPKSEVENSLISVIDGALAIIYITLLITLILTLLFMLSALTFILHERKAEFHTLRALGLNHHKIITILTVETLLFFLATSICAIAFAYGFAQYFTYKFSTLWFQIPLIITAKDVVSILLPSCLLLLSLLIPIMSSLLSTHSQPILKTARIG